MCKGGSRAPSSSSIWHQLPITQNLSSPSTSLSPHPLLFPSPGPGVGWMDTPTFTQAPVPCGGTHKADGMVCQSEGPLLLLLDGTIPEFHQTFQCRNQARFWLLFKPWLPGPCKETSGWIVGSAWLSRAGNPLSAPSPRVSFAILVGMPDLYT